MTWHLYVFTPPAFGNKRLLAMATLREGGELLIEDFDEHTGRVLRRLLAGDSREPLGFPPDWSTASHGTEDALRLAAIYLVERHGLGVALQTAVVAVHQTEGRITLAESTRVAAAVFRLRAIIAAKRSSSRPVLDQQIGLWNETWSDRQIHLEREAQKFGSLKAFRRRFAPRIKKSLNFRTTAGAASSERLAMKLSLTRPAGSLKQQGESQQQAHAA